MLVRIFKKTCVKWFGVCDYYYMNYMIYAVSGMWTLKKKYMENDLWLLYFLRIFLLALNLGILLTMIYDIYLLSGNIEKLTYSLSSTVFYMGSLHRFIVLIPKKDELEECLDILHKNFYLDFVGKTILEEKILKEAENQLKRLSIFFYLTLLAGLVARFVCHLNPLERMLMLPTPFVEPVESPFFEIIFATQSLMLVHYMSALVASEMVTYGCIVRILKHFEIMQMKIKEINYLYMENNLIISRINPVENVKKKFFNDKGNYLDYLIWRKQRTKTLLNKCIKYHQQIRELMQRLNKLLSPCFFMQIFGGGVLLAILFVDVMWKSRNLSLKTIAQGVYAFGFFVNITILCTFGSKIETVSHETANYLYSVPWLEMDLENRKNIAFFLDFLWRAPFCKAGGVFPVNLKTFLKCVQLIYNVVAFWQNSAIRRNL